MLPSDLPSSNEPSTFTFKLFPFGAFQTAGENSSFFLNFLLPGFHRSKLFQFAKAASTTPDGFGARLRNMK